MVWEELEENLIFPSVKAKTSDEVLEILGGALIKKGYVKNSYIQALKEREVEFPTGLDINGIGIAIPHTSAEHVNNTATCIGILKNPVLFYEMGTDNPVQVRIVFMLAVTDPHAHIDQLKQIILIIQDRNILHSLLGSNNPKEIIQTIKRKEQVLVVTQERED